MQIYTIPELRIKIKNFRPMIAVKFLISQSRKIDEAEFDKKNQETKDWCLKKIDTLSKQLTEIDKQQLEIIFS